MTPSFFTISILVLVHAARGDNLQILTSATSDFSQKLYQKIAQKEQNAIYSPYSIHSALSMTSLGARGETATELTKALGLTSLIGSTAHQAYHNLIVQLNNETHVKLHTANAIFANPAIHLEAQFVKDAKTDYLAQVTNFDLAAVGGPEKIVNDFVNKTTEGLIKDILSQGTIDGNTVAILVNTIFFNGTWLTPFSEYRTQKLDFQQLGGRVSKVDMMHDDRYVNIKRNVQGVDIAELPFKGNRYALYIALPQKVDGLAALENALATPANVNQLFEGLSQVRVKLSIPKFKIESKFELNAALQQLGIVKAFDSAAANFQGISQAGDVHISDVLHKAVIEVKETGTVAAAVTAIVVGVTSVQLPPADSFNADHPFVFFLRDKTTGEILFQGKFSG